MQTVLFLHGFYASGSCVPATALKEALEGKARVITPDLPLHPRESIAFIRDLCDKEQPDLLVGNSCGSFYAQIIAPLIGVPALLGNPHFEMDKFPSTRIGKQQYKSPRRDGDQEFIIDKSLIAEFADLQQEQFNYFNPYYKDRIWGIFGEQDTLAKYKPLFLEHYNIATDFPGGHTPTAEETKTWYAPLAEKMLINFPKPQERYFQHFKGGKYRYIRTVFNSETLERMVVYQALYGEQQYWVRPEKMFFEHVTREGRTFSRFMEIDKE